MCGRFASAVVSWHSGGELASTTLSIRREFYNSGSGRGAIVVAQQAAQALAPLDLACVVEMARLRADESVGQLDDCAPRDNGRRNCEWLPATTPRGRR